MYSHFVQILPICLNFYAGNGAWLAYFLNYKSTVQYFQMLLSHWQPHIDTLEFVNGNF